MRRSTWLIVVLAGGFALVGCTGMGTTGDDARLADPNVLERAGLSHAWDIALDLRPREEVASLHVIEDMLYVLTTQNRAIAVDAQRGYFRWTYQIDEPGRKIYAPVHANNVRLTDRVPRIPELAKPETLRGVSGRDLTLFGSQTTLAAIERTRGGELRRIALPFAANTGGDTDGIRYYCGSVEGLCMAVHIQDAIRTGSFYTADILTAPVEVSGSRVYAAGEDGRVYCRVAADLPSGGWTRDLGAAVTAEFHASAKGIFVPCTDNRIYAFAPDSGTNLWRMPFVCDAPLRAGIQVADSTLFQQSLSGAYYAVDLARGEQRWKRTDATEVLAVVDGRVYLRDTNNNLLVVDEILGELRTAVPLSGAQVFARNTTLPGIWVASRDGHLLAIRPGGAR